MCCVSRNLQVLLFASAVLVLWGSTAARSIYDDQGPARLLGQSLTPDEAASALIISLTAAKNGDKKERQKLVALNYFYFGCGGKTRSRDPKETAANVKANVSKDPRYVKAGVVKIYWSIVDEAMEVVLGAPPTAQECNDFYGTRRRM